MSRRRSRTSRALRPGVVTRGSGTSDRDRARLLGLFLGNLVAIVWIWVANHNLDFSFAPELLGRAAGRLGGLTGLLGAYLALVQVLLLARLPLLGRVVGFDRLTVWHRWNGYAVPAARARAHRARGPRLRDRRARRFFDEFWTLLADDIQSGW